MYTPLIILASTLASLATSAAVPQPAKVCQALPVKNPHLNCGIQGHLVKPAAPFYHQNTTTADRCGYACLTHPNCMSFDFNTISHNCALKAVTLDSQGAVHKQTNESGMVFYARNCFTSSCAPLSTTSSSGTQPTQA